MSGGHYNYACHQVSNLADDIEQDIKKYSSAGKDEWGYTWTPDDPEILSIMQVTATGLHAFGELAHDVEWYMSSDYGQDTLKDCYKEWLVKYGMLAKMTANIILDNTSLTTVAKASDLTGITEEHARTWKSHSYMLGQIAAIVAPYLPDPSDITTLEGVEILEAENKRLTGEVHRLKAELAKLKKKSD